jgi:hypothetical protein
LTRVFAEKTYEVEVLADSFRCNGKTYGSLSALATDIAQCNRNGYEFFNLGAGPKRAAGDGTPRPAAAAGKDYSALIGTWLAAPVPEAASAPPAAPPVPEAAPPTPPAGISVVIGGAKAKKAKAAKPAKPAKPAKKSQKKPAKKSKAKKSKAKAQAA